jgi:hypothetical protein
LFYKFFIFVSLSERDQQTVNLLLHSETIENRLKLKENEMASTKNDICDNQKWREKYFNVLEGEEITTKIMTNQIKSLGQSLESATEILKTEKIKISDIINEMEKVLNENFELKKVLEVFENIRTDNENLNMLYLTAKTEAEESVNRITELERKIRALENTNLNLKTENLEMALLQSKYDDDREKEKERDREEQREREKQREEFAERLAVVKR